MADIILVHGAYHGGWSWRDVAPRLRRAGHNVFTPSLTGLGDRMPQRIAALFYLDCFVPVDGDSHLESRAARPGAQPIALPDGAIASPPPDAARQLQKFS